MSYNPVRAKNFYKQGRPRPALNPHAGTKHSEIMRRQGIGSTMPMTDRTPTPYGLSVVVFQGESFTVRSEVIGAGNNLGFGVNEDADRLYQVMRGVLFVFVEGKEEGSRSIFQVQSGGTFRAPRGLKHGVAASGTAEVEIFVAEDNGYQDSWNVIEQPTLREFEGVLTGNTPEDPQLITSSRRTDQRKAKTQAVKEAVKKARRQPRKSPTQAVAADGNQRPGRARTSASNPNSANVLGTSPMPMGPPRED